MLNEVRSMLLIEKLSFSVITLFILLGQGGGCEANAANASGEVGPDTLKKWHDICISGNVKQIDDQIDNFEKHLNSNSNDYLAQVYLGGAYALRAEASFWGPSKLSYLKRAEKMMDTAVAAAPSDARVRMVNAIGSYRIPVRFKRRAIAVRDFKILVPIAKSDDGELTVRERQAVLYYAFLTFTEEGINGAQELKGLCHQLDSGSKYGKLTQ